MAMFEKLMDTSASITGLIARMPDLDALSSVFADQSPQTGSSVRISDQDNYISTLAATRQSRDSRDRTLCRGGAGVRRGDTAKKYGRMETPDGKRGREAGLLRIF